ncbi:MAG: HNH endonuclease [Actinomycetota bacterium]
MNTSKSPPGVVVRPRGLDREMLALVDADLGALDRDGLMRLLDASRRIRSKLDAIEVRAHRRMRELESIGAAEPAREAVAAAAGGDGRHGRTVSDRDELCLAAPEVEDALDDGSITGVHADAIAKAGRSLPDAVRAEYLSHADELLKRSSRLGLDAFRRECRQLAKQLLADSHTGSNADELESQRAASKVSRWTDRVTGMCHTMIELDPIRDHQLQRAARRELQRLRHCEANAERSWQELEVEAWVNCVIGATSGPATDAGPTAHGTTTRVVDRSPQILAVVDVDRLRADVVTHGLCETSDGRDLPISTLRRLCCDAEIIPTVLDGAARVLDHGRARRTASPEQRHALTTIHASCAFPGCDVGIDDCRIHHVDFWTRDVGPTDLANLAPVCEHHHHRLHEGGWTLRLDADRIGTWRRPDGEIHHVGPTADRRAGRQSWHSILRGGDSAS